MNQVRVGPGDPRDARDGYCGTAGPFELATSKEHIFRYHKVNVFWRLDALKDLLFVLLKTTRFVGDRRHRRGPGTRCRGHETWC